jgi:hypothetical protein
LTQPNPYAAPQARVEDVAAASSDSATTTRQEHIKHEASIRSVAVLYFLSAVLKALGGIAIVWSFFISSEEAGLMLGLGVVYLGLSALSFAVWRGLRAFRSWARTTAIVLGFEPRSLPGSCWEC